MIISVLMLATDSARNVGFLTQYITVMTNYITMHYPGRNLVYLQILEFIGATTPNERKSRGELGIFWHVIYVRDVQVCHHNPLSYLGLSLVGLSIGLSIGLLVTPSIRNTTTIPLNPMCLSYSPMWDRWDCPKESHVYHHTTQSYVYVLSYSPMWDRQDRPKESHVYHHTTQSYVSVLSYSPMWDRWDCPKESHVYHHTTQSYVSVLSYSPMWDRWDRPKESHVYHHTTQSYVSVLSYSPTWDCRTDT